LPLVEPVIATGPPTVKHVAMPEPSTVAMLGSEEIQATDRFGCVDGAWS
jgi:hypothetical protein